MVVYHEGQTTSLRVTGQELANLRDRLALVTHHPGPCFCPWCVTVEHLRDQLLNTMDEMRDVGEARVQYFVDCRVPPDAGDLPVTHEGQTYPLPDS